MDGMNADKERFWAHSGEVWQPLGEHLENVAGLARRLALLAAPRDAGFQQLAEWCGLLHDYGKYTNCFRGMIRGEKLKCPHAIHGAAMAFFRLRAPHVASAIAGHHAGMPDLGVLRSEKAGKARKDADALLMRASADLPLIGRLLEGPTPMLDDPGLRQKISPSRLDQGAGPAPGEGLRVGA
jgi:CRISPR-associated endonuclease Cas3-HD